MTEQSRLDAAQDAAASRADEWYRSPLFLVAGMILFVGALVLVAMSVGGGDDDTAAANAAATVAASEDIVVPPPVFGGDAVSEVGVVTVVGDRLPPFDRKAADDVAAGSTAPVVTTTSLGNGAEVTLGPGRARVIGFFAHWCPHCQREVPEIAAWLKDNRLPANTEFIAVSTAVTDQRDNYPPSEWFTREQWPGPVIVDDEPGTLMAAYGMSGYPAFVAIDANGIVVERVSGNVGTEGLAELFSHFAGAPQG